MPTPRKGATMSTLLDDPDLEGMTDDEKRNMLDGRIAGLRSTLAGVMLDGATVHLSVDIPAPQRDERKKLLNKQEQALRQTLGAIRALRAEVPDEPAAPAPEA